MWKDEYSTSGFKVTYTLPNDSHFEGYPAELSHMFGYEELTEHYESIELSVDLEKIYLCVDRTNKVTEAIDFEGFEFFPIGGDQITLSLVCPSEDQISFDLTRKRLIGFKAITTKSSWETRNIRTLCPIIDEPDCSESAFFPNPPSDMTADILGDPVTQVLQIDWLSAYYGNLDGRSFCSFSFEIEFHAVAEPPSRLLTSMSTHPDKPLWLSTYDNLIVIGANTVLDAANSVGITVKILDEDESVLVQEQFTASLECSDALC